MTHSLTLPFDEAGNPRRPASALHDQAARQAAVDPTRNVVLEASAGTGKTRVLVDRYLNLLGAGVDPRNILAMTFTRKAAAEMRERIVAELRAAAQTSPAAAARWRSLRDRLNEIAISTIDAFCLALLREFPLEADLDPGFEVADETDVPRLVEESLDQTLRICRARARTDDDVALLFAQLGEGRLRAGLAALLDRRLVAETVLARVMRHGPRDLTIEQACRRGAEGLAAVFRSIEGGLDALLDTGPIHHPRYRMLTRDIRIVAGPKTGSADGAVAIDPARLRGVVDRLRGHFFTLNGTPRKTSTDYPAADYSSASDKKAHWAMVTAAAPALDNAIRGLRRDLNAILARAVSHVFGIAVSRYRRTLEAHGVLDFGELLARAQALLGNMDEFARSRYLLEARYHHVLVDEFQDTSRAQWDLVSQLVRAWGEGLGLSSEAALAPSIFVVGDRKQSIYGFRDAEVALLDEAAASIRALREADEPVRTISHSFRSVPALLAFANDVFLEVTKAGDRSDAFRYDQRDAFPVDAGTGEAESLGEPALGFVVAEDVRRCAGAVAAEIARLLAGAVVRDRQTGEHRAIQPGDIAILFRSRESHRDYEQALEERGIPTYVYKGLGFFDADEVKDIVALIRYVADPASDLRAAAFLRSRFVRLSDPGIQRLAPAIARALTDPMEPAAVATLDAEDQRVVARVRDSLAAWLALADRVPPAELLDRVLHDSAYAVELRGPRTVQARENVKKIRSLVRRIQNRGYLTLAGLAAHLDRLSAGDESNAVVDAIDAVNLMTVHASKGLEFPVVFVVNLSRGSGGRQDPIRITAHARPDEAVAVGDFQTEFDEDARARQHEETKRLLYVAITRARDRLYLTTAVERGGFRPKPGSLGEVLPESLRQAFTGVAGPPADGTIIEWRNASGQRHRIRVCAASAGGTATDTGGVDRAAIDPGAMPRDDFEPLVETNPLIRVAVTGLGRDDAGTDLAPESRGDRSRVIVGRLVHRLFQAGARGDAARHVLIDAASRLLTEDERGAVLDRSASAEAAADLFSRMWLKADVRAVFDGAECLYEVPVSLRRPGGGPDGDDVVLRGVIDCVVQRPSGDVMVLDFKTGAERDADTQQLAAYVEAARALFPGAAVEGRLVYP